jgi:dihydroflavonol-4-reductase
MMYRINVDGTRKVVDACLSRGLRLVHTSSHHALVREPLDQPLTEDKPLALDEKCQYHRSKAIGETIVLDACERGLDAVIVNPGSMIGPHDYEPSMIGAALIDMYFGRVPVLLELLSDYVDVRDVADGMIAAAEKGRRGERYFLTGDVIPIMEMVSLYGELTGAKVPTRALPLWVGWALLPFALAGSAVTKKPPFITADMLRASVSNEVVSHEKARRELGYTIRSLRESLGDAVAWYRERGWLGA